MKKLSFLIYFCLFLLTVLPFLGGGQHLDPNAGALKDPTKWNFYFDKTNGLKVGDVVSLIMETPIQKEYHIYSVREYAKPGPTPTTFSLDKETKGIQLAGKLVDGLPPTKHYDDAFELDAYEFQNRAKFIQSFKITDKNPKIVGVLRYQFCNESGCDWGQLEIDQSLTAEGTVNTTDDKSLASADSAKGIDSIKKTDPSTGKTNGGGGEKISDPDSKKDKEKSTSGNKLWESFFIAFAAGLLSLITPCVFPMIPMTVTFFLKRSKDRKQGIKNALLYTISLISIFTALGFFITVLFGANAIADFAINSWVNLVLFAVIFLFGLSFLGMFDLTLPSAWTTALDKESDKGGLIGIFFMALVLVVASFSCIGPIAGPLLFEVASDSGSRLGPLVGMTGYGLGFAIPFGLFALFPGWLQTLPKSGGWLNSVKVTLGFLEIALSLKFLSQSDLREQWGLLDRDIFLSIWIATFIVLGVYLLGKIRLPHDSETEKISVPRSLLAVASFGFALYLIPGLFGAPLSKMAGILPPPKRDIGVRVIGGVENSSKESGICGEKRLHADHLAEHAPPGFCMFYDLDEAKVYAKKVNKPIFIDFTGHTCPNCRQMEQSVWPQAEIKKLLTEDYVMVSLYLDDKTPLPETIKLDNGKKLRTFGDKWSNYQVVNYGNVTKPYYVLTDANDKMLTEAGRGYTPDVKEYQQYLQAGLKKFKESAK